MIKDQCNNCKKNGTDNCGQTIIFNSLPCEHYAKKLNLSKQNDKTSSTGVTTTPLQPAQPQTLANIAKRCHDLGKSGFFGLLLIIPLVNIAIGIYLAFFQGDLNDNEYGPSPY